MITNPSENYTHIPLLESVGETLNLYKGDFSKYNEDGSFGVLDDGFVCMLFPGDYDLATKVKDFIADNSKI